MFIKNAMISRWNYFCLLQNLSYVHISTDKINLYGVYDILSIYNKNHSKLVFTPGRTSNVLSSPISYIVVVNIIGRGNSITGETTDLSQITDKLK